MENIVIWVNVTAPKGYVLFNIHSVRIPYVKTTVAVPYLS